MPVAGIADRGENVCGETIQRMRLSGELVATPAIYTRCEISESGPPTWPSPPGKPGTVWQPPHPYRRMIAGARAESPPVIASATRSVCRCDDQFRPTMIAAAAHISASPPPNRRGLESARSICAPRFLARAPDPDRHQCERGARIYGACRHPHDDSCQLLVFERGQSPCRRSGGLRHVKYPRRQRHQRTEHAGVQHGDKHLPCGGTCFAAAKYRPPEQDSGQEKAQMLQTVDDHVGDGGIEQRGGMPSPDRDGVQQRGGTPVAEPI